jgi:hypothetical protein
MTDFQQVRFLGASIRSFTSHIGWGSQASTLSVDLAEDNSNGDVFLPPAVGSSVFFNYLGWTFGGILQSWKKIRGEQGNAIYTVNVEDARDILNGVNLIISNYNGGVTAVPNLYNIYGYIESNEGFGAANINQNGISWTKIRDTFNQLQLDTPIRLRSDSIRVDLSQLPEISDSHRIAGPTITLMDFIADICSAGSRDYFFTYGTNDFGQNTIYLITIDRSQAANLGLVTGFLNSLEEFNESELGVEFRNEATSKFLIGGPIEKLHATPSQEDDDITNDNFPDGSNRTIWPYFGLKEDLSGIRILEPKTIYRSDFSLSNESSIAGGINGGHLDDTTNGLIFDRFINDNPRNFTDEEMLRVAKLAGLHTIEFYNPAVERGLNFQHPFDDWYNRATKLYKADLNELRAALGGQDAWETFLQMNNREFDGINNPTDNKWYYFENTHYGKNDAINIIGLHNNVFFDNIRNAAQNPNINFNRWLTDNVDPLKFSKTREKRIVNNQPIEIAEEIISEIYETIRAFAEEYFGKKYLVSVPSVAAKFDPETG